MSLWYLHFYSSGLRVSYYVYYISYYCTGSPVHISKVNSNLINCGIGSQRLKHVTRSEFVKTSSTLFIYTLSNQNRSLSSPLLSTEYSYPANLPDPPSPLSCNQNQPTVCRSAQQRNASATQLAKKSQRGSLIPTRLNFTRNLHAHF
jgi:hypothetical protein